MRKVIIVAALLAAVGVSACSTVTSPIVVSKSPDGITLKYHKITSVGDLIYKRDQQMDLIAEQHCWSKGKDFVRIISDTRSAAFVTYTYVCRFEPGPHSPL
jgi:hypothetical protein